MFPKRTSFSPQTATSASNIHPSATSVPKSAMSSLRLENSHFSKRNVSFSSQTKYDQLHDKTGYRQCCVVVPGQKLSQGSDILIVSRARQQSQFVLRYRAGNVKFRFENYKRHFRRTIKPAAKKPSCASASNWTFFS